MHCVKYGLTTHNLLEVTLVTMDGELLTLGSGGLDGPGYDLLALVTGSEGMLGVVVEARLKLLPLPESIVLLQAAFPDLERAGRAVMDIVAAGVVPAGLEMMDQVAIEVAGFSALEADQLRRSMAQRRPVLMAPVLDQLPGRVERGRRCDLRRG